MTVSPEALREGVPYELRHLPAWRYYVVAQLLDADDPAKSGPLGAYPDFCEGTGAAEGPVTVDGINDLESLDITLYGSNGAEDPCQQSSAELCPEPGKATVAFEWLPLELADEDVAIFALFDAWPATGAPRVFSLIPNAALRASNSFVRNDLEPGEYVVYFCLDRGGDDTMGVCGDEDDWVLLQDGAPLRLEVESITEASLELAEGGSTFTQVDAVERGCNVEPGKGALELTVRSTRSVAEGDQLRAALFESLPPVGPPLATASLPLLSFPATLQLDELEPGQRFVWVCHDVGGEHPNCDGAGDLAVFLETAVDIRANLSSSVEALLGDLAPLGIEATFQSSWIQPAPPDTLRLMLYTSFPPAGPPLSSKSIEVTAFPVSLAFDEVGPGSYWLGGCFDAQGDHFTCDGPGDVLLWEELEYDGSALLSQVFNLDVPASLQVELSATTLQLAEGDQVSLALFSSFPPAGPPLASKQGTGSYPLSLSFEALEPGEYFLSACHDLGSDSPMCNGTGDVMQWYGNGQAISLGVAQRASVTIALP
jgi:uncharacterized protein (DUF2141 family)